MAALDTQVKDGVEQETVDAVASLSTYKYGWETDIEMEYAPKGLTPRYRPADLREEQRARMDDRMASRGL